MFKRVQHILHNVVFGSDYSIYRCAIENNVDRRLCDHMLSLSPFLHG